MLLDSKSARRAHIDEEDTRMIERLLRQTNGEIPFDENTASDLRRLEDCGLTFQINGDIVSVVEDTFPEQSENNPAEIVPDNDDDEYWGVDVTLLNPADFISEEQENHRRKLKIGPLSYKIAWTEGYTFDGKGPLLTERVQDAQNILCGSPRSTRMSKDYRNNFDLIRWARDKKNKRQTKVAKPERFNKIKFALRNKFYGIYSV